MTCSADSVKINFVEVDVEAPELAAPLGVGVIGIEDWVDKASLPFPLVELRRLNSGAGIGRVENGTEVEESTREGEDKRCV